VNLKKIKIRKIRILKLWSGQLMQKELLNYYYYENRIERTNKNTHNL